MPAQPARSLDSLQPVPPTHPGQGTPQQQTSRPGWAQPDSAEPIALLATSFKRGRGMMALMEKGQRLNEARLDFINFSESRIVIAPHITFRQS